MPTIWENSSIYYKHKNFPSNYSQFLRAWHYHNNMELVPLQQVTEEMATTTGFTVEFNFSQIQDLPLIELVATLLKQLPQDFVFIQSRMVMLTESMRAFCKKIGREDINFIVMDGDISSDWWEEAKIKYFINNSYTLHELSTAARLCREGRACGRLGMGIFLNDVSVVIKNTVKFYAAEPNWQIIFPYSELPPIRMHEDYQDKFIAPNFLMLLLRAFLKEIKLNSMSHIYRMFTINKINQAHSLAVLLSPTADHSTSELTLDIASPPFYPGLIRNECVEGCYVPPGVIFKEN